MTRTTESGRIAVKVINDYGVEVMKVFEVYWSGRAIEPLVRDALARLLPDGNLPAAPAIGGFWARTNDVEIDIVGADRGPFAKEVLFVGSVKWLENSSFDRHDLAAQDRHRSALTPEPVPVVAISRSGVDSPARARRRGRYRMMKVLN